MFGSFCNYLTENYYLCHKAYTNNMNKYTKYNRYISAWIFLLTGLLNGIGLALFPPIGDDLQYMTPWREYLINGQAVNFGNVIDFLSDRYTCDNGRLANVVMTLVIAPLPRLVGGLFSGLVFALILYLGARLGDFLKKTSSTILWTAALVFLLPWHDQLYLLDFQLNYLWTSALLLLYAFLLLKGDINSSRHKIALITTALILGFWHEGFGIPTLCATILLSIVFKAYRCATTWWTIGALFPGSIYLMCSPAMLYRPHDLLASFSEMMPSMVYPYLFIGIFYLATITISAIKNRKTTHQPIVIFSSAIIIISGIITYITEVGARAFVPGIVMACLGIVTFMSSAFDSDHIHNSLKLLASAVIYIFTAIHLLAVDMMCLRLGNEYESTLDAWRKNPKQTAFVDMTLRAQAPWICLSKPHYDYFAHYRPVKTISSYYFGSKHARLAVPAALADYTAGKGEAVEGSLGARFYRGCIVGPWLGPISGVASMTDDYGWGTKKREYYIVPFRSRSDGKVYSWYYPNRTNLDCTFNPRPQLLSTELNLEAEITSVKWMESMTR